MRGLYTAIVTPFLSDEKIDIEGFRSNIQYQISEGVDGIVVLGTTGESPTLNHAEREILIRAAVQETRGQIKVLVGTGSYATKQTIESTIEAEELGADGALIVTPYYNKPTQEGLYRHFKAVSEASKLPIIIYNIQGRTGQNLQTSTLQRLMDIPSIVSVKESSGSVNQIMDVIDCAAKHRPDFTVLSGDDILTFALMALGGHGIVSVVSNLIPGEIRELVSALQNSDYVRARQIHYRWLPLFKGAFIETNPIPIKAAMNLCGFPAGTCRLPLCELLPENAKTLECLLEELQIKSVSTLRG